MTNLRSRFVATLTVWESLDAARAYMRAGAHGEAMRNHYRPSKDPNGHSYVTDGGFHGFKPLAIHGSVGGPNPADSSLISF